MNAESTSLLKHDQNFPNHDDDDSFRARKTMTKTLATRAIVVVVCVAAIVVGATYMSTGTLSIDSHAGPSVAGGLLREGSTTTMETGMATGTEHGSSSQTKIKPPLIVGGNGCHIHKFKVYIQNNLDVPLHAMYGTPSEGNLRPDGCTESSGKVSDYHRRWSVQPGKTNYISATTSSGCKGVEGTFTYGPLAAYTTQTGLQSIALSYKDEGGPHGNLKHDQQFNYYDGPDKGYTFGRQKATDMSKCQDQNHLECEITMTVEITASPPTPIPPSVIAYKGSWKAIGSDVTAGLTAGTSWSNSESSTYGTSFTDGFTEGVASSFSGTSVSASASQTWSTSSSHTISRTDSGSYGASCNSKLCDGILYQWQTLGEYTSNPSQIVRSCFFTCVPRSTGPAGPQCPLLYCETGGCQCCNAVWIQGNNNATDNRLAPSAGGNCTAGCGKNYAACTDDKECCSGRCYSAGALPGGTCD